MYMKSENSEIEVFICPDEVDEYPATSNADEKSNNNSPLRPSVSNLGMDYPTSSSSLLLLLL